MNDAFIGAVIRDKDKCTAYVHHELVKVLGVEKYRELIVAWKIGKEVSVSRIVQDSGVKDFGRAHVHWINKIISDRLLMAMYNHEIHIRM